VQSRARVLTVALTLSISLLGILGGLFFVRSITLPVKTALAVAQTVAQGDLAPHFPDKTSDDETGELIASMKQMVANLGGLAESSRLIARAT